MHSPRRNDTVHLLCLLVCVFTMAWAICRPVNDVEIEGDFTPHGPVDDIRKSLQEKKATLLLEIQQRKGGE